MATLRLDQRRIDALKPRKSAYDVRDRELKGFGVRVLTSGARHYFIHSQHNGRRFWKIVGQAGDIDLDEARSRARTLLAAIRNDSGDETAAPADIAFETVAEEVFRRYARNWKPSTLNVNRGYYKNQILPWFEGRPIADIAASDVRQWFASLHKTPVAADRSAPRALGHHEPGRGLRLPARGHQPVRRHQALPPPGPGALPVYRRDAPAGRSADAP